LANPPFLPVPKNEDKGGEDTTTLDSISQRYGLFSSGGASGEAILERIVKLGSRHLTPGGVLGVVSEFFYHHSDPLFDRFSSWWACGCNERDNQLAATGILFVNEFPIDTDTYASRRADTQEEKELWSKHLQMLNITGASPGMLYIQKYSKSSTDPAAPQRQQLLNLTISQVPRSNMGSIWTPSNLNAIGFTQERTIQWLEWYN
jgi:hypothetical protein